MATIQLVWRDVLNSAGIADQTARHVLSLLATRDTRIDIDLRAVSRMTPSFANTFMMRLLAEFPRSDLSSRCVFIDPPDHVAAALRTAVQRYEAGIRLSDQTAPATPDRRTA